VEEAGLEIVRGVLAHPEDIAGFDAHMAIHDHVEGLGIHGAAIRHQHDITIFDVDAIGALHRASPGIIMHLAMHGAGQHAVEGFDHEGGLLLGGGSEGEQHRGKHQGNNGRQTSH